jgi:ankyrin repeat protein
MGAWGADVDVRGLAVASWSRIEFKTTRVIIRSKIQAAIGATDLKPQMDDTRDPFGRIALHYAALDGRVETIRELFSEGADPNVRDKSGFTPLHLAAQEYRPEAAAVLIDAGADVGAQNKFGNTPLFTATFESKGRGEIIRLLLQRGADPDHANSSGQTPRGLATLIANYDVRQFFAD